MVWRGAHSESRYSPRVTAASTPDVPDSVPPRWIPVWLAFLAPLYVLSTLALLGLPGLKKLPSLTLWILGFYALSQQLPALFAPEPLLASVLALGRTLLILGLIGTGALLGSAARTRPLAWGLAAVFLTAIATNLFNQVDFFVYRLNHPYMTSVTLGLAGAVAVWLALFSAGRWYWRVPLGILALVVLLLSGSRGPLLAALVGVLSGLVLLRRKRYFLLVTVGVVAVAGGVMVGSRDTVQALGRLVQVDVSGREVVWRNTRTVIHEFPLNGVGSYRLGNYLSEPEQCLLFDVNTTRQQQSTCPGWLSTLGQPWLIAHNAILQQLAETGPAGLAGLLLLLGSVVTASFVRARPEPLAAAVVMGLLVSSITDNTLLVPSPFSAELFWLVAGTQLVNMKTERLQGALALGTLLPALLLSVPVLLLGWPGVGGKQGPGQQVQIQTLLAMQRVSSIKDYPVFVQFRLPPGQYMAALNTCTPTCRPLRTSVFGVTSDQSPMIQWEIPSLAAVPSQRLELLVYAQPSRGLQPLAVYHWEVKRRP